MTYNVFGGTLNLAQSITDKTHKIICKAKEPTGSLRTCWGHAS